jgi:DNA-binding Lrp family transcriptional regulator
MADNFAESDGPDGQTVALDDTDRQILAALRRDGRISMRALAEQLHISRASAYARVARLERERVITGYAASVDPRRSGYGIAAYVYVKINQHSWKVVRERVLALPAVEHGALVSGDHDIVLLVRARDTTTLRDLVLTELQAIPEVLATRTELIFDEVDAR